MTDERESMSPTKIGLGVLWPAFWTGLPIKMAFVLVFLAFGMMHFEGRIGLAFLMLLASPVTVFALPIISMGLDSHIGEGAGIALLFLISIPIDIWAMGVVGRTFFLEKFRKEPPDGLGLTLWWKSALVGAIFLPILWLIVGTVTSMAIEMVHSLMEMEMLKGIPIAERISIELTIWGSVASAVLIILLLVGVSLVGRIIRSTASASAPISDSYQGVVTRWDLMRVPADQGLMLTALTGTGVVLSVLFWAALPVSTPHPHECCKPPEVKAKGPLNPLDALNKNEKLIAKISAQVEALEKQKAEEAAKEKGKGKAKGGKDQAPPAAKKP
jgi:phage FluMu protein gp41